MIVLSVSVSTDFKLVRKEHIPHPISTPTALGTTASFEASTAPIGMPYPRCASGMMAIWWKANGRFARSFACERAPSSSSVSPILMGNFSVVMTFFMIPACFLQIVLDLLIHFVTESRPGGSCRPHRSGPLAYRVRPACKECGPVPSLPIKELPVKRGLRLTIKSGGPASPDFDCKSRYTLAEVSGP